MIYKYLSDNAIDAIDNLLRFRTVNGQMDFENTKYMASMIAGDILRKLGTEERREAIHYLDSKAEEIMSAIREHFPHRAI